MIMARSRNWVGLGAVLLAGVGTDAAMAQAPVAGTRAAAPAGTQVGHAVAIVNGEVITAADLEQPGKLRVIVRAGVGVDTIDVRGAKRTSTEAITTAAALESGAALLSRSRARASWASVTSSSYLRRKKSRPSCGVPATNCPTLTGPCSVFRKTFPASSAWPCSLETVIASSIRWSPRGALAVSCQLWRESGPGDRRGDHRFGAQPVADFLLDELRQVRVGVRFAVLVFLLTRVDLDTFVLHEVQQQEAPARQLVNLKGMPILMVTSESSYHVPYDHCTSKFLTQAGVKHQFVRLPEVGIRGNGHMVMIEKNNLEIAAFLDGWVAKNVK